MNSIHFPRRPVLLVDDEEQFLFSASLALGADGINHIVECQDSRNTMSLLSEQDFSAVVLDMLMPHLSGWDLLPMIVQDFPQLPVIIITAVNEVKTAVECMKNGTFDYLVKPVDKARLVTTVRRAIEVSELRRENTRLKDYLLSDTLEDPDAFSDIVTQDRAMRSIFQYAEAIAQTALPVLITGETGVGKEMIARALHQLSCRIGEFMPVNVAGLDDQLFSDTLFGHKKGAFTGADERRKGLVHTASRGTLFLDEIGDLSIESQVKLLRLVQDGKYYPLGDDVSQSTDARIIVATNREIRSLMKMGKFRKDLYYRLQIHHTHLPPLRERRDDIPLLVFHFLDKAAKALGKKTPTPPRELFTLLETYHFPGNIRELEGMVFDAVSRHTGGILSMESFKDKIGGNFLPHQKYPLNQAQNADVPEDVFADGLSTLHQLPALKDAEKLLIAEALKRSKGNQTIAAGLLRMSRQALHNRLSRARKSNDG